MLRKRTRIVGLSLGLVAASATGCGRTVLIPEDSLLRVGPDARIRVWYHLKGEWHDSGQELKIPEGWYLVPPSFVDEPDPLPVGPLP